MKIRLTCETLQQLWPIPLCITIIAAFRHVSGSHPFCTCTVPLPLCPNVPFPTQFCPVNLKKKQFNLMEFLVNYNALKLHLHCSLIIRVHQ